MADVIEAGDIENENPEDKNYCERQEVIVNELPIESGFISYKKRQKQS